MTATRRQARDACGPPLWVIALTLALFAAREASADRYEASVTLRPMAGLGRFTERVAAAGQESAASTLGGGAALGASYGIHDWLDVGAKLVATGFTQAVYDAATVTVRGEPAMGRVTRTTRLVQVRAGATLRLGVAWVPIAHLGVGVSVGMPTAARLDGSVLTPDGMDAGASIDLCVVARIGMERRLHRRWTIGVTGELAHAVGFGGPSDDLMSAGVSLSYTWYPTW